jgi:hypothetical protein
MLGAGDEGVLSQLTIEIGEVPVKGRNRKREIGNKLWQKKELSMKPDSRNSGKRRRRA